MALSGKPGFRAAPTFRRSRIIRGFNHMLAHSASADETATMGEPITKAATGANELSQTTAPSLDPEPEPEFEFDPELFARSHRGPPTPPPRPVVPRPRYNPPAQDPETPPTPPPRPSLWGGGPSDQRRGLSKSSNTLTMLLSNRNLGCNGTGAVEAQLPMSRVPTWPLTQPEKSQCLKKGTKLGFFKTLKRAFRSRGRQANRQARRDSAKSPELAAIRGTDGADAAWVEAVAAAAKSPQSSSDACSPSSSSSRSIREQVATRRRRRRAPPPPLDTSRVDTVLTG